MTNAQMRHIFVEVSLGRGRHGDFLRAFAIAFVKADMANELILTSVAVQLIKKYELDRYLDTFEATA